METSKGKSWAVPLSWLAGLDAPPFPGALPDAFGDSYLCRNNPVFAAVRRSALAFGYRFSANDTPLWRDYQTCGLATLHRILAGGIIPYCDTANTVRRWLEDNPKVALTPAFLLRNFRSNYAFHESAHGVANSILQQAGTELRAIAPDARERFVLEAIFAESFANTVEMLGSLVMTNPLSDRVFYGLNSYMHPKQERTLALQDAAAKTGEYLRFALLFLASFEANLTEAAPGDDTHERIGLAANSETCGEDVVRAVAACAFRLSAGFRESTTPMYFDLLGYRTEYAALKQAGWLGGKDNRQFAGHLVSMLFDATIGSSGSQS